MAGGYMDAEDLVAGPEDRALEIRKTIDSLIEEMSKVVVDSDEKYAALEAWIKRNKETQKVVAEFYEADRVKAKAKYDEVLAAKAALMKPLEQSEAVTREKMKPWATKRETERRAEAARIEAEQRASKEDNLLEEAETLSAMGRHDKADQLLSKGPTVNKAAVAAAATVTKVGKTMEKWTVKVTDMAAFLAAVQGMTLIEECISLDTVKVAALFKKNGTKKFPGLEVAQEFVPVI